MNEHMLLRLRARHAALEQEIDRELATPLPDSIRIKEMKKEKLHVRDRLHRVWRDEGPGELRT